MEKTCAKTHEELFPEMTSSDTDLRLFTNDRLPDRTRRRLQRLIEDLNQEIPSMPQGLRNSFRIIRDMAIELSEE